MPVALQLQGIDFLSAVGVTEGFLAHFQESCFHPLLEEYPPAEISAVRYAVLS